MTEPTQTILDEEHVKEWLKERDVDLTGICSARDLIAQMPEAKPLLGNARTIIIVAKHTLKGVRLGAAYCDQAGCRCQKRPLSRKDMYAIRLLPGGSWIPDPTVACTGSGLRKTYWF